MNKVFYRNILDDLEDWAKKEDRKPLIIRGARQVGKTTAVNMFSEKFEQYLYFNLELEDDQKIFQQNLSVGDLISAMFLHKNKSRKKGKTLVFIDEIQNVPMALSQLRYFYESAKDLYVVASGSLLKTVSSRKITYPVGRVEFIDMYPLTFLEYLKAIGVKEVLRFYNQIPAPGFAHSKLLKHFHRYTLLGGMPEIIKNYIKTNDILPLNSIYNNLITAYKEDVKKYARNEEMARIIRFAIDSCPYEAGTRIKFQGFGNSNYGSEKMGEALKTLEKAMLINIIYPTTNLKPPIVPDSKKSPKLQFLDTGLINFFVGLQEYFFTMEDLHSFHKGLLAEHMVGQELKSNYYRNDQLSFWVREKKQSSAEVDFVVPFKRYIIPIEVKAGKSGTLRSLHQFIDRTNHPYAVRFHSGELSKDKNTTPAGTDYYLLNLPYYLAGKLRKYLEWFIS
ncbi:ATP-binding protein [candidate division WOR-3 bacterium]|nr:ATP-binding protein [candidate division WOR-3 bacterium]